ncbi:MAG: CRTAC1 family protein [Planctomycetota bacterium]
MRREAAWSRLGLFTLPGLLLACEGGDSDGPATGAAVLDADPGTPPATARFRFVDALDEAGLGAFVQDNGNDDKLLISESAGGGVAFLDYDRDGDLDIYLSNGSAHADYPPGKEPADALYENRGDGTFRDRTREAGLGDTLWTQGVRVADYDGDRWPDIYLTNHGPNVLYRNRGDGTFEDVTARAGVGDPRWSTGSCFLDYDRDGDLDLYVANYIEFDAAYIVANEIYEEYRGERVYYGPRGLEGARDRFYENRGDGTFADVSARVGIDLPQYYGFQAVPFDCDEDGWVDIYVANDSVPNLLWRNDGKGRFEEIAMRAGLALSIDGGAQAGMGIALGDYDGDLLLDLYVTNFAEDYHTLYRGDGNGFFSDVTMQMGLATITLPYLGWGCGFEDFDSDGDSDLFAVHGHVFPQVDLFPLATTYRQRPLLFENSGARFRDATEEAGPGFALRKASRGTAVGDYDEDGDLDLLIGSIDERPALLRNDSPRRGNWVKVRLVGRAPNTDAIGARLVGTCGEMRMLRLAGVSSGFLSTNDPRLHFGLGTAAKLDELRITWPDGTAESHRNLAAGAVVVVEQGRGLVGGVGWGERTSR